MTVSACIYLWRKRKEHVITCNKRKAQYWLTAAPSSLAMTCDNTNNHASDQYRRIIFTQQICIELSSLSLFIRDIEHLMAKHHDRRSNKSKISLYTIHLHTKKCSKIQACYKLYEAYYVNEKKLISLANRSFYDS